MKRDVLRIDTAAVADIPPAIELRVRIQEFNILSGLGHADPIIMSRHRCEIAGHNDTFVGITPFALKCDNAPPCILEINPFKPAILEIDLVEGGFLSIQHVQGIDEALDTSMRVILPEVPVKRTIMIPLDPLSELLP